MSVDNRRNGTRKYGKSSKHAGRHAVEHAGRRGTTRLKPARRAGKAIPAAAIAATLAAGAAAYTLTSTSTSQPDTAQLSAALSSPIILHAMTLANVGKADAAAASPLVPQHATATPASQSHAQSTPPAQPAQSAKPSPAAQPTQAPAPQTQAPAATTTAPSPTATSSPAATATTVSCSDNSYLLPANVTAIVSFLLANGYSDNAAAGIAGNIYQESKGDPESIGTGGGGLIGWTPLPSGFVTGNPAADLQTQLPAILSYNNGWSSYIPELNSAATPANAAYIYVTDFERAGIPAASTREASAEAVASACSI